MKTILMLAAILVSVGASAAASTTPIAMVQYDANAHFADYSYNRAHLTAYANQAVSHGSKLIIFPEGSLYGYANDQAQWCNKDHMTASPNCRDVSEIAEAVPQGPSSRYWISYAQHTGAIIVFNLPEADGDFFYNTSVVVGPQGFITKYRKRDLYYLDETYADPGNLGPVSFDSPEGSFGLLICADANDPHLFLDYKAAGVTRVIVSMDWDQDPLGTNGARPARLYFQKMARATGVDIFASDDSPWDGTGAYIHTESARKRLGLAPVAIGVNGVTYR